MNEANRPLHIAPLMPNVFISPHLGSATKKTRYKMAKLAVSNLISFSTKGRAPNKIN